MMNKIMRLLIMNYALELGETKMTDDTIKKYNYVVYIGGTITGKTDDKDKVWDIVDKRQIWQGFMVGSETGADVGEFIPF